MILKTITDKKFNDKLGYIYSEFESMYDLKDYIIKNEYEKYTGLIEHIKESGKDFFGTNSFEEAFKYVELGKKDLTVKYMKNIADESKSKAYIDVNSFKLSEQGTIYDIGSVIQGIPECCIEDMPLPQLKKHITIYVDMGYCGSVEPGSIDNRGIALYNFINTLIRQNYIVDVKAIVYTNMCHNATEYDLLQLFDISKINNKPLLPHLAFMSTSMFFRAIDWMTMSMAFQDYSGKKTWDYARSKIPYEFREDLLKNKTFYIGGGYTNHSFNDCSVKDAEKEINWLFHCYQIGIDDNSHKYRWDKGEKEYKKYEENWGKK